MQRTRSRKRYNQATAMERLSKNERINSSNNGVEGLSESDRLGAEVRGLAMAARNANAAISMLEIVEGATGEIVSMLQRMHELAAHAASDSYSLGDLTEVDTEFGTLLIEIQWIAENTFWNTMVPLNGHDIRTPAATSATTGPPCPGQAPFCCALAPFRPRAQHPPRDTRVCCDMAPNTGRRKRQLRHK